MRMYADGSAYLADQSGGWAWWVDDTLYDSGFVTPATNNTMEIMAVIQGLNALAWLGPLESVEVVSDSAYVVNCMKDRWFDGWRRRGWRKSDGERVVNQELWEELLEVVENFPVPLVWTHVRGHGRGGAKDAPHVHGNDRVDQLAGAARKAGITGVGHEAAQRGVITKAALPKRRKRLTLKALDGVVFVTEGGHRYVALDVEEDGTVLLLEEGK